MNKVKIIIKKIFRVFPHSYIYVFHHVTLNPDKDVSTCKLDTEEFYKFISLRKKNIVSMSELLGQKIYKKGKSVITFDDGIKDVYTIVYPFFKKNNIPFTIFVLTEKLDQNGYITTEELRNLSKDPLVTIGAHGTNHKILTQLSKKDKEEEIIGGKYKLEEIVNKKVELYAYSHGLYDRETINIVKKCRYKYGFSVRELQINFITKFLKFTIPRYNIDSTTIKNYL